MTIEYSNSEKKVLITGSNGMLGKHIIEILKEKRGLDIFGLNRTRDIDLTENKSIILDLTDLINLNDFLEEFQPDIIIHCAAMVDIESCEKNRNEAYRLNVEATKLLASFKPNKTKFIFISTDSVFDGKTGNYNEKSRKNPINYYALTKNLAEEFTQQLNINSVIIRTNIYGFHKQNGKSLVEWALSELCKGNMISGFNDVFFNPVYTKQLARIIITLIERNFKGIMHVGSSSIISKYDFIKLLSKKFNINSNYINSISIEDVSFRAKRPKNTMLNTDIMKTYLNLEISIVDGLNELVKDYKGR